MLCIFTEDTEIEYFPLSPTLTRIRVHKQNITPLSQISFPLPPVSLFPIDVCSSYSQIQIHPNFQSPPLNPANKIGSLYCFPNPSDGIKLQTIGEQGAAKVVPKPRKLGKKLPVYENLPTDESNSRKTTFADLKRSAPSSVKVSKKSKKPKVPLSESVLREKPLSKVQKRIRSLPEHLKKRRSASTKRPQTESTVLSEYVEAELGQGYLTGGSSTEPDADEPEKMNPIFDTANPKFTRREADYPPFRSRSFSPGTSDFRKPSPPERGSSRNSSTLRMWSKMMVTYPYHRSRIDSFDSNVKFIQDKLQKKISGAKEEEFGDDVETVRTVRRSRDGQMTIKTNRFVKIARPVSAGPVLRHEYDQNGRRVRSETSKPEARKVSSKKPETVLKSSTSYPSKSKKADEKKSVKVTVSVSSKGKDVKKSTILKKPVTKVLSPSTSVSSFRSGTSGKSVTSDRGSTASSLARTTSPRVLSPVSTVSRVSSSSRTTSPAVRSPVQKTSPKKVAASKSPVKAPVTIVKDPKKTTMASLKVERKPLATITNVHSVPKKRSESLDTSVNHRSLKEEMEMIERANTIRSDSFFQHLFLREPPDRPEAVVHRSSSVLDRARSYQRNIERQEPRQKSENSINLAKFFLTQKRPVSSSRFKSLDRELSASRSPSPALRSRSQQEKIRKFETRNQFGDDLISFSPEPKFRSLSEPPVRVQSTLSEDRQSTLSPVPSSNTPSKIDERRGARARSAGEVDRRITASSQSNPSTSSLHLDQPEYQAYVWELLHSSRKNERFRELHKFYASLERIAELEKTASIGDLRPRLKNEEIIDFDRWKKLRTKERAEDELKALVGKLNAIQKEKDLVFRTTDIDAFRWKGDIGLRAKDRSVEDLKEKFIQYSREESEGLRRDFHSTNDNYKPLWRGSSIVNLASTLNSTTASHRGRPVNCEELQRIKQANEEVVNIPVKRIAKGRSSLSKKEVTALKNQLSEIYSQELKKKNLGKGYDEAYVISVPDDSDDRLPGEKGLFVRCTSLLHEDETYIKSISKKDALKSQSISSVPNAVHHGQVSLLQLPWKDEKNEVQKAVPCRSKSTSSVTSTLSEGEKKRISMNLSKEVMEKVKAPKQSPVLPRETLGAVATSRVHRASPETSTMCSPRTCYSLEMSEDGKHKNDFLLVLTPTEKDVEKAVEDWANGNSGKKVSGPERRASAATTVELESVSASSETSVRTVIKNPVDVLKKVEYFEDLSHTDEETTKKAPRSQSAPGKLTRNKLSHSHSEENVHQILGEQRKFTATPISIRSTSEERDNRSPSEERGSMQRHHSSSPYRYRTVESSDSLYSLRSRSVSPDPTKYYRAYLRTLRGGEVRRICHKFESLEDLSEEAPKSPMKKSVSDPELTRDMLRRYGTPPSRPYVKAHEYGNVQDLRNKYESGGRGRSRSRRSPIPRVPLTRNDRFMPRINVISKTAELQLQKLQKSRLHELPASPEPFRSLTEYTRDHGAYNYIGEVERLRRKFEKLREEEAMTLLGHLYTSTPDVNELRHIAPYLGCSWVAHQHPEVIKTSTSSPDLLETPKKFGRIKPRPHSSSPVRPKKLPSILKPFSSGDIFANQKFDPLIHRPKYRYQPEPVTCSYDRRLKWAGESCWPHWNKPSVTFKGSAFGIF